MRSKRKNYLPGLLLSLSCWLLVAAMIIWVDPVLIKDVFIPGVYLPFWLVFFPACFFTLALLLGNTARGLLITIGLCLFLLLKILGFGNLLNLLLIVGIVVALDRFWHR